MSKSSSANSKETDYIPDIIRDDHNGIVYKKGAFFGKVRATLLHFFCPL